MKEPKIAEAAVDTAQAANELPDDMRDELIGLNAKRAHTYALLSRLFKVEVDAECYRNLREASFPTNTGNEQVDTGYRMIARYLSNDHGDAITELAVDYVRVFIGHGNTAYSAAYPFESVYTSERRLLKQDAYDEVMRAYCSAGLDFSAYWRDPEDHVALELEYMQTMSSRVKDALENREDTWALALLSEQSDFLERHLISWVPMMTIDMRTFAQTEFYLGLSYLTEGFLPQDKIFLNTIIA